MVFGFSSAYFCDRVSSYLPEVIASGTVMPDELISDEFSLQPLGLAIVGTPLAKISLSFALMLARHLGDLDSFALGTCSCSDFP